MLQFYIYRVNLSSRNTLRPNNEQNFDFRIILYFHQVLKALILFVDLLLILAYVRVASKVIIINLIIYDFLYFVLYFPYINL